MGLKIKSNFDWSITNKKLCIFIPNYNRQEYVEFGIKNIITSVPRDDWVIIIGNDNCHYDFNHLQKFNVYYFSLLNDDPRPRNSCFIRNYAIKRCQSSIFFQKDPEVVVVGDFIKDVINCDGGWRLGHVFCVSKELSRAVLVQKSFLDHILSCVEPKVMPKEFNCWQINDDVYYIMFGTKGLCNVDEVYRAIVGGGTNISNWFAYAFGVETSILKEIGGYDEDYTSYGYEDSDLFCRLMAKGYPLIPDHNCVSVHLHHPLTVDGKIRKMSQIFASKDYNKIIRNGGYKWGTGI